MIVYQLTRKTQIGSSFMGCMRVDRDVLFFTNKADAKALQNTFNGDKIKEIETDKMGKFIFNIRLIFNCQYFGKSFTSLSKAKTHCKNNTSKFSMEVYKHKVYTSLNEYKENQYKSKLVHA